jgi:peptidoglycan hydrolase-like protein with peptidoglycan-binding domain
MSKDLTRGDRTDAVALFVNILVRLGFLNSATDNFDAVVEEAVKAFQQERGLKLLAGR